MYYLGDLLVLVIDVVYILMDALDKLAPLPPYGVAGGHRPWREGYGGPLRRQWVIPIEE